MSLYALPVSVADIEQLQLGIQFFTNSTEATAEAAAINAPNATETVFVYAAHLLQNNTSLSQVAMADTAIMEGGTVAIGNANTPDSNTVAYLATQFLPSQVAVAIAHGFNPTVYASEALGLAIADTQEFNAHFGGLNETAFVQAVANATGVNASAITSFVNNWGLFYSGVGYGAHIGLTITQAAYGAAFGDAIGVALLNPTEANLATIVFGTPPHIVLSGLVANALIVNAEGHYQTGVSLDALPVQTPLQGNSAEMGIVGVSTDHIDHIV